MITLDLVGSRGVGNPSNTKVKDLFIRNLRALSTGYSQVYDTQIIEALNLGS